MTLLGVGCILGSILVAVLDIANVYRPDVLTGVGVFASLLAVVLVKRQLNLMSRQTVMIFETKSLTDQTKTLTEEMKAIAVTELEIVERQTAIADRQEKLQRDLLARRAELLIVGKPASLSLETYRNAPYTNIFLTLSVRNFGNRIVTCSPSKSERWRKIGFRPALYGRKPSGSILGSESIVGGVKTTFAY